MAARRNGSIAWSRWPARNGRPLRSGSIFALFPGITPASEAVQAFQFQGSNFPGRRAARDESLIRRGTSGEPSLRVDVVELGGVSRSS